MVAESMTFEEECWVVLGAAMTFETSPRRFPNNLQSLRSCEPVTSVTSKGFAQPLKAHNVQRACLCLLMA